MADSATTEHTPNSKMELFSARSLPETELATIARHIASCSNCGQQFVSTLRRQKGATPVSFTLAPEFWLRHDHLDYEQLVDVSDNKLDRTDGELIQLHLSACPPCREDVTSFLAFREKIAPELEVSNAPIGQELTRPQLSWITWWRGLALKPVYATAAVVIGIVIVIGVGFLLKRRAETLQAQQVPTPQVSPTLTPGIPPTDDPSTPATPNQSPVEKPNSAETLVVLNDSGRMITVDKSGDVVGLDGVPAPTRDHIAKVLLSENLERPTILKTLEGHDATLRGSNNAQPFKLTYPSRTVIVSDRPILKWERASGAGSYRVYVNDATGHEVAKSDELPPERTEWTVPKPLMRGRIYAWTVVAIVNGREIVSPGPSSPEVKFQVLSLSNLQQLNRLKRARSHLALGIFYAKVGLMTEAEREFQGLVRLNPKSRLARHLLRSALSLRDKN